ncbi:hypothetical protein [Robbsia andropogonis]|uniref:hypothetical protein n=1 Tax=Robbsia andropogonis TaxID=28092 RepID=UPI000467B589|nr:hypothetical protein [Robbsia andropogonis]
MTPDQVITLFEDGYVNDTAPKVDDATASLAIWLSKNQHLLTPPEWSALVAIGSTLFERGMGDRMERSGFAGRAADMLLDKLQAKR